MSPEEALAMASREERLADLVKDWSQATVGIGNYGTMRRLTESEKQVARACAEQLEAALATPEAAPLRNQICSNCGHGVAQHEWDDETSSRCLECTCVGFAAAPNQPSGESQDKHGT